MLCRKLPYEKDELLALSRGKIHHVKPLEFDAEVSSGKKIYNFAISNRRFPVFVVT